MEDGKECIGQKYDVYPKNKPFFVITSGATTIYKDKYTIKGTQIIITLTPYEKEMLCNKK